MSGKISVVTGAFGYSGRRIARLLLARGDTVRTLTNRPVPPEFAGKIEAFPLSFQKDMGRALEGADTLYNTYWVRYEHGQSTFARAVENAGRLFDAAEQAGVKRVVHTSVANPEVDLPYYRGKLAMERDLKSRAFSHGILRPSVIFGEGDILINNIAWFIRRLPVFAVPGDGTYGIQPVYVEDFARLALDAGSRTENLTWDAMGPEKFTFDGLLKAMAEILNRRLIIAHVPPLMAFLSGWVLGKFLGDVVLTKEEVDGMVMNLLVSHEPARGTTRLTDWLRAQNGKEGARYVSEVSRHFK